MTSRWRAALRIAAREARRAKGRSVLVVALLALPIVAMGAGDVLGRTMQLSPAEHAARTFGDAAGLLHWVGGKVVEQTPDGQNYSSESDQADLPTTAQVATHLPAGSRLLGYRDVQWQARGAVGIRFIEVSDLPYRDRLVAPLNRQVSGRAPRTDGEIALSPPLAKSLGVGIGDTISIISPTRTLRVVGLVRNRYQPGNDVAFVAPGSVPATTADGTSAGWYVATATPIRWRDVPALNAAGFVVQSREVTLHPPARRDVPAYQHGAGSSTGQTVSALGLVVGMAVLEIILLAGPAFAVGARRSRRALGLVAAVGGNRADLRNVVLAGGVVLGVVAGVVGLVGGIAIGLALLPLAQHYTGNVAGHIDLRVLELGLILVVSLATGLLAAWLPARAAARTDVLAVLRGRRGSVRTPKRIPIIGALAAAAGAVVAIGGATTTRNVNVVLVGVIVAELGLIACTPTLVGLSGRIAPRLPLTGRIALRDSARNRGSVAPAVAAIMAAVTGGVAAATLVASINAHDRRQYQPALPKSDIWAAGTPTAGSPADALVALRRTLPVKTAVPITGVGKPDGSVSAFPTSADGSVPGSGLLPQIMVSDGSDPELFAVLGARDAVGAAVPALRSGEPVVFDRALLVDGKVTISVDTTNPKTGASTESHHELPAVLVPSNYPLGAVVIPPTLASAWHLPVSPAGIFIAPTRSPTGSEVQRAQAALLALGMTDALYIERGYHANTRLGLLILLIVSSVITLGAASIATALAGADGRPDLVTLAAIGASPGLRRRLAAARAGVIAVLGTGLGIACGFIAPFAYLRLRNAAEAAAGGGDQGIPFTIAWPNLIATAVVVPVLAMGLAYLFTRSRLPVERSRAT